MQEPFPTSIQPDSGGSAVTETAVSTATDTLPTAVEGVDENTAVPPKPTDSPEPGAIDLDAIPPVDTSIHSVPLEDIVFDTFQAANRAVRLPNASEALILQLRDAIPPIYDPVFETAVSADTWLDDNDLILGYADGDEAYAYAVRILNFHEIVSHEVNGRAVAATYCPLCRSGVMYDRELDGQTLLLGNTSALYESDMVMLDHQTGSYWVQVSGAAVVGTLTGSRLTVLPSQTTTWGAWKTQHPQTVALSRDTGYSRNYSRDPFIGYRENINRTGQFAFPVTDAVRDPRLDPGALVLGVHVEDVVRAYPLEQIDNGVVNDVVGETAVVVFVQGGAGAVYTAVADNQPLTFSGADGVFTDAQTSSTWNMAGQAIDGTLTGIQLTPLPSRASLWFALIAAFPELDLYLSD
ncbi:MAG: DUF3179 domain-containing protein [Chloroflexi bacterium]|nr:DUF3179 domain-containing protein [Chloroflexota bacterium]